MSATIAFPDDQWLPPSVVRQVSEMSRVLAQSQALAEFNRRTGEMLASQLAPSILELAKVADAFTLHRETIAAGLKEMARVTDGYAQFTQDLFQTVAPGLQFIAASALIASRSAFIASQISEAVARAASGAIVIDQPPAAGLPVRKTDSWGLTREQAERIAPLIAKIAGGTLGIDQALNELVGDAVPGPLRLWWSIILTLVLATLWVAIQKPDD